MEAEANPDPDRLVPRRIVPVDPEAVARLDHRTGKIRFFANHFSCIVNENFLVRRIAGQGVGRVLQAAAVDRIDHPDRAAAAGQVPRDHRIAPAVHRGGPGRFPYRDGMDHQVFCLEGGSLGKIFKSSSMLVYSTYCLLI